MVVLDERIPLRLSVILIDLRSDRKVSVLLLEHTCVVLSKEIFRKHEGSFQTYILC